MDERRAQIGITDLDGIGIEHLGERRNLFDRRVLALGAVFQLDIHHLVSVVIQIEIRLIDHEGMIGSFRARATVFGCGSGLEAQFGRDGPGIIGVELMPGFVHPEIGGVVRKTGLRQQLGFCGKVVLQLPPGIPVTHVDGGFGRERVVQLNKELRVILGVSARFIPLKPIALHQVVGVRIGIPVVGEFGVQLGAFIDIVDIEQGTGIILVLVLVHGPRIVPVDQGIIQEMQNVERLIGRLGGNGEGRDIRFKTQGVLGVDIIIDTAGIAVVDVPDLHVVQAVRLTVHDAVARRIALGGGSRNDEGIQDAVAFQIHVHLIVGVVIGQPRVVDRQVPVGFGIGVEQRILDQLDLGSPVIALQDDIDYGGVTFQRVPAAGVSDDLHLFDPVG